MPQRRNNICGSPNKYSCRTQMGRFQNIQRVVRDKGLQSQYENSTVMNSSYGTFLFQNLPPTSHSRRNDGFIRTWTNNLMVCSKLWGSSFRCSKRSEVSRRYAPSPCGGHYCPKQIHHKNPFKTMAILLEPHNYTSLAAFDNGRTPFPAAQTAMSKSLPGTNANSLSPPPPGALA